eukprot:Skav230030  [mRNA]  locus=scaffold261:309074:316960:- [translate_table: standard]
MSNLAQNASRRLAEESGKMSPVDCAYAAGAFLRGPASIAENVLKGAIGERILELRFGSFDPEALTLMLNSLSRAKPGVWGVEAMASSVLEEVHSRLHELDADQLALVARSLGYLQPEVPEAQIFWSFARCSAQDRDAVLKIADRHLTKRRIASI